MILLLETFLEPGELESLRTLYDTLASGGGHESAGGGLAAIKHNREIRLGERAGEVRDVVLAACNRVPMLNYALLPKTVSAPILSAYEPGMHYGTHIDSAIGNEGGRLYRTDLSCTVFLDDPADYDGGELVIDSGYGESGVKLPAGGAVFYPTLYPHRVAEVTRGCRRACVFWLESFVRDSQKRAILHDLAHISLWMSQREPLDSDPHRRLVQVRENLYRMWLET